METFNPFVVKTLESNLNISKLEFDVSTINNTTVEIVVGYEHNGIPLYFRMLSPTGEQDLVHDLAGYLGEDIEEFNARSLEAYDFSMLEYIATSVRAQGLFWSEKRTYKAIQRVVWGSKFKEELSEFIHGYGVFFEEFTFSDAYRHALGEFLETRVGGALA